MREDKAKAAVTTHGPGIEMQPLSEKCKRLEDHARELMKEMALSDVVNEVFPPEENPILDQLRQCMQAVDYATSMIQRAECFISLVMARL